MNRLARVRAGGDDGAALIMALVFMVVVAFFASAALDKSASTTMSGAQLRDRAQLQYALDGAVERALDVLQDDLAKPTDPTLCTEPSAAGEVDITAAGEGAPGLVLNGHTVRYSCETLAGKAGRDTDNSWANYALVMTDEAPNALTTQSGSSTPLVIGGSLYLAGPLSDAGLKKPVAVADGSVVQLRKTCNREQLRSLTQLTVDSDQLRECTDQTVEQATPSVSLPTAPTSSAAYVDYPLPLPNPGNGIGNGNGPPQAQPAECRVFTPGAYDAPPPMLTGNGTVNWFVGGLYHFDFAGTWTIPSNASVVVASVDDDEVDIPSDCPAITDIPGASSTDGGGTFVFGGSSKLVVQGSLAMATPVPTSAVGPGISLMTARDDDADKGYAPWTSNGELLLTTGNATTELVLKGKLLAPDARAELFASNPTTAMLQEGAVLFRLALGASVAAQSLAVQASGTQPNPPPTFRTVRIRATDAAGSTATQTAIASISNSHPYTVTIHSWRSE